jgi:hypothetical protein
LQQLGLIIESEIHGAATIANVCSKFE